MVVIRGEMDSRERWCSSNAPWRARTPIVIGSVLMVEVCFAWIDLWWQGFFSVRVAHVFSVFSDVGAKIL